MVGLVVELSDDFFQLFLLVCDVGSLHLIILDVLGEILDFFQEKAVMLSGLGSRSRSLIVDGQFEPCFVYIGQGEGVCL